MTTRIEQAAHPQRRQVKRGVMESARLVEKILEGKNQRLAQRNTELTRAIEIVREMAELGDTHHAIADFCRRALG